MDTVQTSGPIHGQRIIFLDIDGVLNNHIFNEEAQSGTICRECVTHFNRLIHETAAKVVISSAWRYMVHGGAIGLDGFGYLLRTHGVTAICEVVAVTCRDEYVTGREHQILHWLRVNERRFPAPVFVVLDDMPFGFQEAGLPHVQTVPDKGLTAEDADRAIAALTEKTPARL